MSGLNLITVILYHRNIESKQHNPALTIKDSIRGSSREKVYQELGLEFLQKQQWYMKLCYFSKLNNNQSPKYLFHNIPAVWSKEQEILTAFLNSMLNILFIRNSYFLLAVFEWENLDKGIMNSERFSIF